MKKRHRTYTRVLAACLLGSIVALVLVNLLADPIGAYSAFSIKKFQPWRKRVTSRIEKAELLMRGDCDVLILGSSRMLVGIPVSNPVFGTMRAYNLGLNATTLSETGAVFEHALKHDHVKRVLLGADFLLFSDVRVDSQSFENSRFNPNLNQFEYHLRNLLGEQNTGQSFSLLRDALRNKPPAPGERGFAPKVIPQGQSQREIFAARIRGFISAPETYGGFRYSQQRLDVFRQIVRRCRKDGIELIVFIPPVHALQLETIRVAGLWPTFERWKKDLVRILEEENGRDATTLWDFTGFKNYMAENVPRAGDTTTRMKYYLESSHFTPALGNLVLQRLLGTDHTNIDPEFGVPLTSTNAENHLADLRVDRENYAKTHEDEIAWVNEIAASAKGKTASTTDF